MAAGPWRKGTVEDDERAGIHQWPRYLKTSPLGGSAAAAGRRPAGSGHADDRDPWRACNNPRVDGQDPGGRLSVRDGVRFRQKSTPGARSAAGQPDASWSRQSRLGFAGEHQVGWKPSTACRSDRNHRRDAALVPGHVCGLLGRRAQAKFADTREVRMRLGGGALFVSTGDGRRPIREGQGMQQFLIEMDFPPGRRAVRRLQRRV